MIQNRAAEKGVKLDIGDVPEPAELMADDATEDPEKLTRLVSRIVARIGDRFTWIRKISRHFEGNDKRAGILSDVVAAAVVLYKRNPDAFEQLGGQFAGALRERRNEREQSKTATTQPTPQPPTGG